MLHAFTYHVIKADSNPPNSTGVFGARLYFRNSYYKDKSLKGKKS